MLATIAKLGLFVVEFIFAKASDKKKADEKFAKLVQRMDDISAQYAALKLQYDFAKYQMAKDEAVPPKEPGI